MIGFVLGRMVRRLRRYSQASLSKQGLESMAALYEAKACRPQYVDGELGEYWISRSR
jgi:uncharacterized protein YgiB involved in biofilm formation